MIGDMRHRAEFEREFTDIFDGLVKFARKKGIDHLCGYRNSLSAEDPDDFAQDCLIEYSRIAECRHFQTVQTPLIKRIARDRVVDAWRKRAKIPKRECFDATANQLTERAGSPVQPAEREARSQFLHRGLSNKATDILRLKYVALFQDREIANALNMTVDGVRSSLKRSKKTLLARRVKTTATLVPCRPPVMKHETQ